MNMQPAIRDAMVAAIPKLRRFAVSLAGRQQADDLVQQTLLQACSKIELFHSNGPLLPWLITILRNRFYSECRKRGREVEDVDGSFARSAGGRAKSDRPCGTEGFGRRPAEAAG